MRISLFGPGAGAFAAGFFFGDFTWRGDRDIVKTKAGPLARKSLCVGRTRGGSVRRRRGGRTV